MTWLIDCISDKVRSKLWARLGNKIILILLRRTGGDNARVAMRDNMCDARLTDVKREHFILRTRHQHIIST